MKMNILSGGRVRVRKSVYFPDADRTETLELPVSCILLRHGSGNVLFDSGCHPSVATDAEARWGALARAMTPVMTPDDNVLSNLKAVDLSPDDIDIVVCSHLHPDHCGCNQFFRNATIIIQARELEAAKVPQAEKAGYLAVDWDHPMKFRIVDGEVDLFNDKRINLIPLPGHTPGMMGALVRLDSQQFFLASDAVSLRANFDARSVPRNTWNADACLRSYEVVKQHEANGATVICGHDQAQWSSLRRGDHAYT